MSGRKNTGPLKGLKVLEFAGLGPAPFCCMLLGDMGAEVLRIERPGAVAARPEDVEHRSRRRLEIDLKSAQGRRDALKLAAHSDVLVEGYRPGVMERLGLGPEQVHACNPALVYGRMTGWGQDGPLAGKAGHDLNYLAITGALHAMGTAEKPAIPLNLVADFGGGALYLAMGILAAWHHARTTGEGQVVDCAMTDGVISMMGMIYGDYAAGTWHDRRADNVIDGGAPFYNVYRCADEHWISVAAIEPVFHQALLEGLGLPAELHDRQWERAHWSHMNALIAERFMTATRDQWCERFENLDACVTPVLSLAETAGCSQHQAREAFITRQGVRQPAPAPRFSRTPGVAGDFPDASFLSLAEALASWTCTDS